MRTRLTSIAVAVALIVPALVALAATPASAATFSNPGSIALRDPNTGVSPTCSGGNCATAATYPSTISVTGQTGTISSVSVTLNNVSYAFSDDIDALLVGPGGQSLILVAAVGPNGGAAEAASNSTLTISDSGTLPTDLTAWGSSSTFKPANFGSFGLGNSVNGFNETYPSPAPAAPWGDPGQHGTNATLGNTFDGLAANGTWSLYVITTSDGDGTGAIAGGWTLNIATASAAATTTTLTSAPNPSFTSGASSSVTLTATVSSTGTVSEGTVAFKDGGTTIAGCGAVSVSSGQATCTTTFTTEGPHALTAVYAGTANFALSSGGATQQVDDHTTGTAPAFCNTGSITLNNPTATTSNASPYPSHVFVSGLSGTVSHLTVSLNNATYGHSQDIDALLVGPTGQTFILVAAAGPDSNGAISNVTLTLDDNAVSTIASTAPWGAPNANVTSKPVNYGGLNETWGAPAPAPPYGNPGPNGGGTATLASAYNGSNPNGTWSLFVITTAAGDGTGAIAGGWCATITTGSAAATTTTVTSDDNPSFTASPNNGVTFTATVHKASDASNVGEGTVTFTDGGTTLTGCGAVAVVAGQAQCTKAFTVEGEHDIVAQYNGTVNFGGSNDSLTQVVNSHTTVTGNSFCNTGGITLNNPASTTANASPYPSNVFVTGAPTNITHLTVSLKGTTYGHSQDIDALLVGPTGQTFILVAAAGPNSSGAISNVTLTLDDSAASTIASTAPWGAPNANVTSKPVNYGGVNETWGAPAPAPPYGNPGPSGGGTATLGSAYNSTDANGTWSLYAITTAAGDGTGAIAGGWCVNITGPQPPTLTKAFGAATVPLNGSTSLSFTVTNPNATSQLSGIGFTDTLPAGLTLATPAGKTGTCGSGSITAADAGTTVSLSGATLASSATCTFSVNVKGVTAGSQVNTTSAPTSVEGGSGAAATATLVVVAPPAIVKSFTDATIPLNGSTTLILTVSNPLLVNTVPLTGVAFTDTLPAGLVVATNSMLSTSCGISTTALAGSGTVSVSGVTLPINSSCTVSVSVTGTTAGTKNNSVTVTSTNGGTGNTATASLSVLSAGPSISKSFGAATIPLGGSTTLSFTITNPVGNGTQGGIGFTDTLPSGLLVSSPPGLTGSCGGGTITAPVGSPTVSLSGASLADGASCTFSVNVTGIAVGVQNNSVTVSSTNGGTGNTATASVTVVAPPSLTKAFGASTIALNGSTSLTFTVTNPNAGTTLTGIEFNDTLPTGLIVSAPNGLANTCANLTPTFFGSTVIDFAGGTLGANATCTVSVNITGTAAGVYNNVTSIVASDNGGFGPDASASITVAAGPVMIAKSFGASTIPLNGSTTLSFTITNPTANGTSTGIAFTDSLPSGLVVSTPNGLTGTCDGGTITADAGSSMVSLTGATLSGGATCTFSVSVTGTTAGVKNNSVTVGSTTGGDGNTAMASVTVVAPPTLSKSFGAASIPLAASTTLTFTVANPNSTVPLSGVGFTDTLPSGLAVSMANGLSGSCGSGTITATAGSSSISLTGATLTTSGSCTFAVNVTGSAAGSQVNTTGNVTSTEGGTGGTATATLTVVAPPSIVKSFTDANIPLNGTTSLIITVSNPLLVNTVPLTGVAFTDTLPAGLVVATNNMLSSSCGISTTATPGSGTVSIGGVTLATNSSCTVAVSVTGTTSGTKNNSVTATSTNGGTGNTATATVFVASPVTIAKSFGAMTIPLNGSTTLTFTIGNPSGNGMASGIAFTDSLPSGLVVSSPNGLTGSCGVGTITATAGSTGVSLSGATLADGGSCSFSVSVTGTTAGVKNNSVTVSSTTGGTGNTATASVTVVAPPTLTKAFGAASVPLPHGTILTFTVSNPNATVALSGVAFSDTLPSGLVVGTPNGLNRSCSSGTITATAGGSSVSLSGLVLSASNVCTFMVAVTATAAGTLVNTTGPITSNEGGTGGTATATLDVVAPPVIAKSFSPGDVALGGTSTLTFTLSNPAVNTDPENGVGFVDTFPSGMVVANPTNATSTCADANISGASPGSSTLTASAILIPVGASCIINVDVVGNTAGALMNAVTISSTNGGTGKTATASLLVAAPASITKSFGAATIPVGGSTTLSFTIANPNSSFSLTGVAFTDTLPAGLAVSTPNGLTGTCGVGTITATAGSGTVTLSGAPLAGGASCTFSVSVTGTNAGVQSNSVTVTTTNAGTGNTSTASITVVAPPTLSKLFGASSVPLSGSTSLSFTVSNPNSTVSLSGIGFTDTLPAGLVVATPPGTGGTCTGTFTAVAGSGSVALSGLTLAANGTCTLSVNVTGVTAGSQVNTTGAITSTEGGTGGTATATLTVVAPPVITKAFGAATIALNGTTSLTITLTNPAANTVALTGVGFSDTFPSGLLIATPSNAASDCADAHIIAAAGSGSVTASQILLPLGVTCTISLDVTGTTNGVKSNSVTVTSTNGGTGNTATASLSVAVPASITKSFGAATIPLGGSTTLSFTIANPNSSFGLNGAAFTDTLPAGLAVSTPNGLTGTCGVGTITATAGSGTVTLSGATLAGAASCTFSVNVTGTTAGVKNNSVTVTTTNAGTGNTSTASITVVAPPTLSKSFGAPSVALGATTSLTFNVANPNTTISLSGIGFTDTLPAGLVVATPPGTGGSCGGTITAVAGSGSVSLSGLTLAANGSCSFSVNVTGVGAGSQVNTTSAITSTEGGTGSTATATLVVLAPPVITKAFGAATIALNGTTTLTFTITNPSANTVDLIGVGFTDTLPAGLVVATPNGQSGACGSSLSATPGSSTVNLSGLDVPPHSACQLSVNVTGTTEGVKNNSVTVSSTNGGTGNTATASVTVARPPSVAKSFGAPTIPVNASTTLSFTITNPNTTFGLTGVGFTDTLPAGVLVKTPNGLTGACGAGTITATAGSGSVTLSGAMLVGGASCTFSVKVTGTTAGVKNNSVTVTSTNAGTGNTATASITVVAAPTLSKSFGAPSIPFGGSTSLSFTATNPNATVALTGVGFTDTLPAGLVVSTPNGATGTCGGTITAVAGSTSVSLAGAALAAGAGCSFSVNVTAVAVGVQNNTTSAITSANGGTGATATASVTVAQAPTTTTVVASSPNPAFGTPVSFTATVVPSGPNGSGVNPTGTVSFFLDGSATPIATVGLSGATASFTTAGLGAGAHTVAATYNGDTRFLPSTSSPPATVTVPAGTTVTGTQPGTLVLGPGTTLIQNATISGAIIVPSGSALDLENSTVKGAITSNGSSGVRICGSTLTSVTINNSTGPVVVGDAKDGCAPNNLSGSLTLNNNTDGLQATGNTVAGSVTASGNSGAGPFPDDPAPDTSGNHH